MKRLSKDKVDSVMKRYGIDLYNYGSYMYNEYPHKSVWSNGFNEGDFEAALRDEFVNNPDRPRLLYIHIPFCLKQCLFCICHTIVTDDTARRKHYLNLLFKEIVLLKKFFDQNALNPLFEEIHIGGGSPTVLLEEEFDLLIENIKGIVDLSRLSRFSIEIDPRMVNKERLKYYHAKGINRLSFGVQDFDPFVQKAINRIQPPEAIENLLTSDIRSLFKGVNFDILCGLPGQTEKSFKNTIQEVIRLSPDRLMLMFLTYSPDTKKHQQFLAKYAIPDIYERITFFDDALERLLNSGYLRIGVDHFAKPSDDLSVAMRNNDLHWNSLGYGPKEDFDIIGLGLSSSSRFTDSYYTQNVYEIQEYESSLQKEVFPVFRSYKLTEDDKIRRDIIHSLRTYLSLDWSRIEKKYGIDSKSYFRKEKLILNGLAEEGIVEVPENSLVITEAGKHFSGLACRAFDSYRPF